MTAQYSFTDRDPSGPCPADCTETDALHLSADPLAVARSHIAASALTETPAGSGLVGLELELHLVDLDRPARRPDWERITEVVAGLPAMPSGSSVTLEPGGQIELSTPPVVGVAGSVAALEADRAVLAAALLEVGLGAAPLGTDPAREARRVNPSRRYVAMETHFAARGCAGPGRAMMTATAALQVNLDAGPRDGWARRTAHIRDLSPVLVAVSACSPLLGGTASGWHSMRQQAWHGIDHGRTAPIHGAEPAQAWADYALDAPLMLVRDGADAQAVTTGASLADWVSGRAVVPRPPRVEDLDYHLTTLFPPIRPRGYLELRCLDAVPDRWWPALATIATVLVDDPVAADSAAEACAPVRDAWLVAARDGLADRALHAAATACLDIAVRHAPPSLHDQVDAYAELVAAGRTPGDEIRERATATDPLTALLEEARA
ncbi:ergothioneine biosynthesis glutamate--cysteine ligase EgtA [uncultured Jatrophihabitans sp.]|uniref:ergothioneine biosynthesis glutamate--cysteine ligase EgtA n=1 Tax=uncultured Jatrophihabitans sp. TaxID=1610747 RepID=UPI0035CB6797